MIRSGVNGGLQICQGLAHIQLLKSELDTGGHIVFGIAQLHVSLQTVKNGWGNGIKALFGITIDNRTNVRVDAKDLLYDHDCAFCRARWARLVGAEFKSIGTGNRRVGHNYLLWGPIGGVDIEGRPL